MGNNGPHTGEPCSKATQERPPSSLPAVFPPAFPSGRAKSQCVNSHGRTTGRAPRRRSGFQMPGSRAATSGAHFVLAGGVGGGGKREEGAPSYLLKGCAAFATSSSVPLTSHQPSRGGWTRCVWLAGTMDPGVRPSLTGVPNMGLGWGANARRLVPGRVPGRRYGMVLTVVK